MRFRRSIGSLVIGALAALGTPLAAGTEEKAMFTLTSDVFKAGESIPRDYTCDGPDRSPALRWQGAPEGTKAFAIICDDPDAPVGNWNHWLLWDIPAATTSLDAGVPTTTTLAGGARQGKNDFGRIGYGGPCPPKGSPHRYFFKLYALSTPLGLEAGSKRGDLLKALDGKTLATAELMGKYGR